MDCAICGSSFVPPLFDLPAHLATRCDVCRHLSELDAQVKQAFIRTERAVLRLRRDPP